jgi:hypothetical protein
MLRNCLFCDVEFNANEKEVRRGNGKFCTLSCSSKFYSRERSLKKIPNVECALCKKKFYKSKSDFALSKSGLFFCCRKHKDQAQRIGGIRAIMPDHYGTSLKKYRQLALSVKDTKCERCGYEQNPAAIVIHHIDKNRDNNSIDNLEVLCSNCHAIEHWDRACGE